MNIPIEDLYLFTNDISTAVTYKSTLLLAKLFFAACKTRSLISVRNWGVSLPKALAREHAPLTKGGIIGSGLPIKRLCFFGLHLDNKCLCCAIVIELLPER